VRALVAAAAVVSVLTIEGVPAARAADPVVTEAAAPPRRETHGLALSLGFGTTYSGLGLQARYDLPIWRSLVVAPFVAGGANGVLPGAYGVTTLWGGRHRAVLDLGVAPLLEARLNLHGTLVTTRTIYGPVAGAGYEHMSDGGWLQRVTVSYGYGLWGSPVPFDGRGAADVSFAVGRRLW
jgi:hypothetical protein